MSDQVHSSGRSWATIQGEKRREEDVKQKQQQDLAIWLYFLEKETKD